MKVKRLFCIILLLIVFVGCKNRNTGLEGETTNLQEYDENNQANITKEEL